jgi:hypothetical protein
VVSIRRRQLLRRDVDYSTDDTFRWSSSGDGERQRARRCVSRPPGNSPARTNPQRQPRVVSIRRRQLLRRDVDYSTSDTHRWSSSGHA